MSAAALRARGHQCVLEETREWNVVELVVNGVIVFSCNIKQLQFGECVALLCRHCVMIIGITVWQTVLRFPLKAEMDNWTLFAKKLLLLWRTLTEDKRNLPLSFLIETPIGIFLFFLFIKSIKTVL